MPFAAGITAELCFPSVKNEVTPNATVADERDDGFGHLPNQDISTVVQQLVVQESGSNPGSNPGFAEWVLML